MRPGGGHPCASAPSPSSCWPRCCSPASRPARPRPRPPTCENGVVVADPDANRGLVIDCANLLAAKTQFSARTPLNWGGDTPIRRVGRRQPGRRPAARVEAAPAVARPHGPRRAALGQRPGAARAGPPPQPADGADPARAGVAAPSGNPVARRQPAQRVDPARAGVAAKPASALAARQPNSPAASRRNWGRCPVLKRLWLYDNQLTGAIPPALGSLSGLISLLLHENQLTGRIPAELGSLDGLRLLWLKDNQLSGAIPSALGSLSEVLDLLLERNQLRGAIPASFGGLHSVRRLAPRRQPTHAARSRRNWRRSAISRRWRLSGNAGLTGCLPASLRDVRRHDLAEVGLPDCQP